MKDNLDRLLAFFSKPRRLITAMIAGTLFFGLILLITDFANIGGNEGRVHLIAYITLNVMLALCFGAYSALLLHKLRERKAAASVTGALGTGASVMVTGCASCSFTVAGFLGLGSFVGLLPFAGLEFSILGLILLGYSIKKLTDPPICTTARKRTAGKSTRAAK